MDARSLLVVGTLLAAGVSADLRMASQPRGQYKVQQRQGSEAFVTPTALYMEPSDFNYNGLKQQRQNAYDNFLRSNIDNEQDKRNFNQEPGRDMLPTRSYETATTTASNTVQTKLPAGDAGAITTTPGVPFMIPLRWNNAHASEIEVNAWIMDNKYVVPIRKPTCSGEGYQDQVFTFTIPQDFNQLGSRIPNFAGCKKVGDCVLQIYAHSVEPRTYSIGTPLIVNGDVPAATATQPNVEPARKDVGLDLDKLSSKLCLSSSDPAANIPNAIPREARLVSDVFNHAYQNSDYSPYSGQQPEAISRNLQASAIISMTPGNRGELGKSILTQAQKQALQQLDNKQRNLVKAYEGVVNNIIGRLGNNAQAQTLGLKNTGTVPGNNGVQKLTTTFRALETGSLDAGRQTTNTYVPSFKLPAELVNQAKAIAPAQYRNNLIQPDGTVQLYEAVLNDMKKDFAKLATDHQLGYQTAIIKTTTATMPDATQFRKRNAQGQNDGGKYAATQAQAVKAAALEALKATSPKTATGFTIADAPSEADNPLQVYSGDDLPSTGGEPVQIMPDYDALNDDDGVPLFVQSANPDEGLIVNPNYNSTKSNSATSYTINAIALCVVSAIGAFFTA